MKTCTRCGELKDLSLFYADKSRSDGRGSQCKKCKAVYFSARERRPDVIARRKLYKQKPENISRHIRHSQKPETKLWWEAYKETSEYKEKKKQYEAKWARNNAAKIALKSAKREAAQRAAMPSWAQKEAILEFYKLAAELTKRTGIKHHVDHIVPLHGKQVSGLHVPQNLRVIPAIENIKKGNRFTA